MVRPQSGPAALMNNSSSLNRVPSVQSLPELDTSEKPKFISAPATPQRSSQRKIVFQLAPLVNLDELLNS